MPRRGLGVNPVSLGSQYVSRPRRTCGQIPYQLRKKYFLSWSFSLVRFGMTSCVKDAPVERSLGTHTRAELLECLDSADENMEVLCNISNSQTFGFLVSTATT